MKRFFAPILIGILLAFSLQGCISGHIDLRPQKYRQSAPENCNPNFDPNLCYPKGYFPE